MQLLVGICIVFDAVKLMFHMFQNAWCDIMLSPYYFHIFDFSYSANVVISLNYFQNTGGEQQYCYGSYGKYRVIYPFHATDRSLYPQKTEKQRFSDLLKGYKKRSMAWNCITH